MMHNTIGPILEGVEEIEALDFARFLDWSEFDSQEQSIGYSNYVDTINGVDVRYDYVADYYFYCEVSDDE